MQVNLLQGSVLKSMLLFSVPMIIGNLLQQLYNLTDTLIVGRFLGPQALAAVGASFTLMVFLTSVLLGLCMGSGTAFSMFYGAGQKKELQHALGFSFWFVGALSLVITCLVLVFLDPLMVLLQIPREIFRQTGDYLRIIFCGIFFTFLYNYFASVLRAMGNSLIPLFFLGGSAVLNVALDLIFILCFHMGVSGAAWATVLAQAVSALGISIYSLQNQPVLKLRKEHFKPEFSIWKKIIEFSLLTSVQQSIMNFGILMIQGLINSFGVTVMAAFAAAVKIDAFAYMPAQDFGNSFSTFIAQNFGAQQEIRLRKAIRSAFALVLCFCLLISCLIWIFAEPLMKIFIDPAETQIIGIGVTYLRIEGSFYWGIGLLFLFYGLYRGVGKPGISVVLTVISLGLRVLLAYCFAPTFLGLHAIWWAIPIGWVLADLTGFVYYKKNHSSVFSFDKS